jgi:carbamoyl-phosphate synthase large subunit
MQSDLVDTEKKVRKLSLKDIDADMMLDLKQKGYSDLQLAYLTSSTEDEVYDLRTKEQGIKRIYKLVDTCAAEFEALTPYYYSSFEAHAKVETASIPTNESPSTNKKKVIVLGSGPNRIRPGDRV